LLNKLQEAESAADTQQLETEVRNATLEARNRIRRNWILTGAFSLIAVPGMAGMVVGDRTIPAALKTVAVPVASVAGVYLIWAALWGIPAVWRWWRDLFRGFSVFFFSSPLGWFILAVSFFTIPLYIGYFYGVFGGAVYEYRKNRKVASGALVERSA